MKRMQRIVLALVLLAAAGFATATARAEDAQPDRRGIIIKVEDNQITLRAPKPGAKTVIDIVVPVDDQTAVTLDGVDAKLTDLKPGLACIVTPAEGTATKIDARTPRSMRVRKD